MHRIEIAFRESVLLDEETFSPGEIRQLPLGEFIFTRLMFFGVLPPLDILNATLSDGQGVSADNEHFVWPPFHLDEEDYLRLRQDIEMHPEWGGEIDDSFHRSGMGEWFHWAFVRHMDWLSRFPPE